MHGASWSVIMRQSLPHRSSDQLRNRYKRISHLIGLGEYEYPTMPPAGADDAQVEEEAEEEAEAAEGDGSPSTPTPVAAPTPQPATPELPAGWRAIADPSTGKTYYVTPEGTATWTPPAAATADPAANLF